MSRIITVGPSGRDYTTLNAAITGTVSAHTSPVADGQPWVFECDAFVDGGANLTISSISTDATRYIKITAAPGAEHGGVSGAGYSFEADVFGDVVDINNPFTFLENIEVKNIKTGVHTAASCVNIFAANVSIKNCILSNSATNSSVTVNTFVLQVNGNRAKVENTLFVGGNASIKFGSNGEDSIIRNCTAVASEAAGVHFPSWWVARPVELTNVVAVSDGIDWDFPADDSITGSFNAGGNTPVGTSAVTGVTSTAFVDYAGGDYRPAVGGALDGAGADLSTFFTDDITGATRTQWDIGAFGIISGSTTPTLSTPTATAVTSNSISFSIPVAY